MTDPALVAQDRELALDGVRYAMLEQDSALWRLGSLSPDWRQDLVALGRQPTPQSLSDLAARGVWLAPEAPTAPLAVMCCGMGSSWPGMGRELYDNFPAARAAMDRLAAAADWDLLSLLDETDLEVINSIRLQIPYLFLLEYAQWSQLAALGLKPSLICGHSLGELVALCLAGVYSPESAWYLLDTRAGHIAALEARSTQETGMLAVSADSQTIEEILRAYPDLQLANRNTARQYILGGSKASLAEIRRNLRRARIPAFWLNIGLAFHNPAMRILREMSMRRLNGLEMHPASVPMLSCVTGRLYPDDQAGICRTIADLDENTVDWVTTVQAMRGRHNIGFFLELGPAETLTGLVAENLPGASTAAASRKGHETLAMRELCARLYSLGYLSHKSVARAAQRHGPGLALAKPEPESSAQSVPVDWVSGDAALILPLIAEATGKKVADLTPDLDLRYDLALRSSTFPLLVQKAEQLLGRPVELENLFQVATVGDLVALLAGGSVDAPKTAARSTVSPLRKLSRFFAPALARKSCAGAPLPLNPATPGPLAPRPQAVVALCVWDASLLPQLWQGLASTGATIAVPDALLARCEPLRKWGAEVIALGCAAPGEPCAVAAALDALAEKLPLQGIVLAPRVIDKSSEGPDRLVEAVCAFQRQRAGQTWLCILQRLGPQGLGEEARQQIRGEYRRWIGWTLPDFASPGTAELAEASDLFALELLYGRGDCVLWEQAQEGPAYCPESGLYARVLPLPNGLAGHFGGECQFSRYAMPELSSHGSFNPFPLAGEPAQLAAAPWLPLGQLIQTLLEGAHIQLPWLEATGLSDLHLQGFPSLPPGLTRECRLETSLKPWLPQNGVMARMCNARLTCRELAVNGRAKGSWAQACDGVCVFASAPSAPPPLWLPETDGGQDWSDASSRLKQFYDALGLGQPWRMITSLSARPGEIPAWMGWLELEEGRIASSHDSLYTAVARIMDGIFQMALFAIACGRLDALAAWRPTSIIYTRFDLEAAKDARKCQLEVRRTWQNENFCRFDAQAVGPDKKPLLMLNHLEFERRKPPGT